MTKKTILIDGLQISYNDNNIHSETNLVFIHGNSSSTDAFKNQFISTQFDTYRLIALDLPGHGNSENSKEYSVSFFAAILTQFIQQLKLKNVILIGHSLGGHVAIQSIPYLNNCMGLFLISSTLLESIKSLEEAFVPHPAVALLFKNELSTIDINLLTLSLTNNENASLIKEHINVTDELFREKLYASIQPEKFVDEISIAKELTIPLAIVIGSDDDFINIDYLQRQKLPTLWNKSIQILSNSKHYPHLECPNALNKLLLQFIKSL